MSTEVYSASKMAIELEEKYGAHNYHPLPVVLSKGEGVHVWDPEGNRYFDFLSAYSAVNQGHCHPRIVKAMTDQAQILTLTSRAFYNDQLGPFAKFLCEYFGFDRMLPMNSGAEAVETAIKLARKWAYQIKSVPSDQAKIVVCDSNFHGRTTTIVSFSADPDARNEFGPFTPGFIRIPYNDVEALKSALNDPNVAAFLVEPIQGEAGVMVPDADYLDRVQQICKEKNVLFIADEIQTGIARTGKLLAVCGNCNCENKCERSYSARPDMLILGKALSGGTMPVSAVLASDEIILTIKPGEHGSTFGGNPLACAVATEALKVVEDEGLQQNAAEMGEIFRSRMTDLKNQFPKLISIVRGKGLLNAVVINDSETSKTAWNICVEMMNNGVLAKPTHGNIIRFAPPLVITADQMHEACDRIAAAFKTYVSENPTFNG